MKLARRPVLRASYLAVDGSWPTKDCYTQEEANAFVRNAKVYSLALLIPIPKQAILALLRENGEGGDDVDIAGDERRDG